MSELLKKGLSVLSDSQLEILELCELPNKGCLGLKLGAGKTIVSLVLGLKLTNNEPILIVVQKCLIKSWVNEITKFFGDDLKYVILHQEYIKDIHKYVPDEDIKLFLTTPQVLSKYYKQYNISGKFLRREIVNEGQFNQHELLHYVQPNHPLTNNNNIIYSYNWGMLIIDEAHSYTKIKTDRSRALASICAKHKWCLSGTIFNEPSAERLLGYYLLIGNKTFPDNLPDATSFIKSDNYLGYQDTIIDKPVTLPEAKVTFKLKEIIKFVSFTEDEMKIYSLMKDLVLHIKEQVQIFKDEHDLENTRKFNAYLLAMLIYLRQCLISPMIPVTNIIVDFLDCKNKSQITETFVNRIKELNLYEYLDDENNIRTSKMNEVLNIVNKHNKIIIFTSFRTSADLIKYLVSTEYPDRLVLSLESTMSIEKRNKTIEQFNSSKNVIFILTYKIGSEGLNLQTCHNVILVDYEWSYGETQQAIGRVARQGQEHKFVNIYYLISNTGVEKAIFKKQREKYKALKELSVGKLETKVTKIKVAEIMTILEEDENVNNMLDITR